MAQCHAFYESNPQHQGGETAAAIADERQRQSRDRHDVHVHADVDDTLEKDQRSNAVGNHRPGDIPGTLGCAQTTPDNKGQDKNNEDTADHPKLFGDG